MTILNPDITKALEVLNSPKSLLRKTNSKQVIPRKAANLRLQFHYPAKPEEINLEYTRKDIPVQASVDSAR